MSIFISHSHKDKEFVDKLGVKLTFERIPVFVDRWEMNVGDSITQKIELAITDSSFLLVVLSKNSVNSDWCKREITSGLMLELERRRVVVLPVLIEDCEIPLFLRDKFYADFREDFNYGFDQIRTSIAKFDNDLIGRTKYDDETYSDFAINWGIRGEYFELNIDVVEFSVNKDKPYTLLTNIVFVGNKNATQRFYKYVEEQRDWLMKSMIIMLCAEDENIKNLNAYLYDEKPFETMIKLIDLKTNISFKGYVTVKKLGISDKKNKIYYVGRIFENLFKDMKNEK
jgi:hypothetical protein